MFNSPIAQIVTPALDTWQTTRFSVIARQSRVEVNAQRDLEEMLAKLDARNSDLDEEKAALVKQKQQRKFIELAVPALVATVLCIVYCLIYLVNFGQQIAHGQQVHEHIEQVHQLEVCVEAIFDEVQARADFRLGLNGMYALQNNYSASNIHMHTLLSDKTVDEWRLVSKIEDQRKLIPKTRCLIEEAVDDLKFYLDFITDLRLHIRGTLLGFHDIYSWKKNYDLENNFETYCAIRLNIITISFYRGYSRLNTTGDCTPMTNKLHYHGIQLGILLDRLDDVYDNQTNAHLKSAAFINLIKNIITGFKVDNSTTQSGFTKYLQYLQHEEVLVLKKQLKCLTQINDVNNAFLKLGIICFICIFFSLCFTVMCIYVFGKILKNESRLVVGVIDWLNSVTSELDEQKGSTDSVVNKIVPKVVKVSSADLGGVTNMIPYHSTDATLFMCSISQFNKFFSMFNASQTLHILTLVMELLDERMEEYNVFPVTRMGNVQVVMSDTVQRHKYHHSCEIANLALDIMTCCSDLEIGKQSMSKLQMKIGIHSGPNYGMLSLRNGVMRFNITGMSCLILQKIHKTAVPNRIQVSHTTYKLLSACETYSLHQRGNVKVKGLPQLNVYWLDGRKVSSSYTDGESACSRIGSWIEFEKKPLYRLDEECGIYEPLDKSKSKSRRYSQMSMESSSKFRNISSTDPYDDQSISSS